MSGTKRSRERTHVIGSDRDVNDIVETMDTPSTRSTIGKTMIGSCVDMVIVVELVVSFKDFFDFFKTFRDFFDFSRLFVTFLTFRDFS